jgi:hypothetical protein
MSIKKVEIKKVFVGMLDSQLISTGFSKVKNNEWVEYVKKTEFGFNRVTPVINQYSTLFFISIGFSIRINDISNIISFFKDVNPNYLEEATTINCAFDSLIKYDDSRIKVESMEELEDAIKLFKGVLEKEANVFFEKYTSVASIDNEVNREDLSKNSVFYGVSVQPFLGLTSAVLNKNPKSKYLENYYREKLVNANQHIKNQYEKLVVYIKETHGLA